MKTFFKILLALGLLLGVGSLRGNNIQIGNVSVTDKDTIAGTIYIRFALSWDHSWKEHSHYNWDAAWVFAKCYNSETRRWRHVYLIDPTGSPVATGGNSFMAAPHKIGNANVPMWSEFGTSQTDFGEKTVGVFIYRKEVGHGGNYIEDIRLQFNYRDHDYTNQDIPEISVFAIEMVYVPKATYIIGDGSSEQALFLDGSNLTIKTSIPTNRAKWMGKVETEYGISYKGTPVPDTFPKGYKAVYMMKHEISQHAYVDFLNTLTVDQQYSRVPVSPFSKKGTLVFNVKPYNSNFLQYRNYIRVRYPAEEETEDYPSKGAIFGHSITGEDADSLWVMENNGGNIACNFLSWDDGLAYLDWACLRPMTEMEFEKACRGPQFLRKSMAWGYQYGNSANAKGLKNPGLPNEEAVSPFACQLETGKAPWVMRVGAFAKDSSTRLEAGAAYYGILNMSDNLWERCINVSTAAGRSFIPIEGDGVLDDDGFALVDNMLTGVVYWPGEAGGGFRGEQISNRRYAASVQVKSGEARRNPWSGFRGVRCPPANTTYMW